MSTNHESQASQYDGTTANKGTTTNASDDAGTAESGSAPLKQALFGNRLLVDHQLAESPLVGLKLLGVSATYASLLETAHKELCIGSAGAKCDIDMMRRWVTSLGVLPVDAKVYYHTAKDGDRATADKVWRVFEKLPPRVLTIVYVALHTEVEKSAGGDIRAFLAADYPGQAMPGSTGMIYYDDIRKKLLSAFKRGSSIMLLTETCYNTNIIGLPYKCWVKFVGGKPQVEWEEVDFSNERSPPIFTKLEWEGMPLTAQSAATEPEGAAAHFSYGAVYTQALCDVMSPDSPHHAVSFQDVMVNIQTLIDDPSRYPSPLSKPNSQVHVMYLSRKMGNNEPFLPAFKPKSPTSPACAER